MLHFPRKSKKVLARPIQNCKRRTTAWISKIKARWEKKKVSPASFHGPSFPSCCSLATETSRNKYLRLKIKERQLSKHAIRARVKGDAARAINEIFHKKIIMETAETRSRSKRENECHARSRNSADWDGVTSSNHLLSLGQAVRCILSQSGCTGQATTKNLVKIVTHRIESSTLSWHIRNRNHNDDAGFSCLESRAEFLRPASRIF